jgi:hypothetical protein
MNVEGYTIAEMAELLHIPYETAKVRLFRAKIKPITKDAIYDKSALDKIKDTKMGRPKIKETPKESDKPKTTRKKK